MNVSSQAPDFPVTWRDPADAALTWFRDAMHFPAPVTPLTGAFLRECLEPGVAGACEVLHSPLATLRHTAYGGWVFNAPVPAAPPEGMEARVAEHIPVMTGHMDDLRRRWDEEYRPRIVELTEEIDALDFSGDAASAQAALDRLISANVEIWRIHFLIVFPKLAAGERFSAIYTQAVGASAAEMDPYRCLQGLPNKSLEADRALWRLAQDARATPNVAQALLAGSPADGLEALDRSPEGRDWQERFAAFLDAYGQRAQAMDLSAPTWAEEPSFAVETVRRFLMADAGDPEGQRERLLAESEALVAAARSRIDDPGLRAAFDGALESARSAWPLEEDHAFYIDQRSLAGATRRAFQRLAVALAGQGRLPSVDDVWFLDFDGLRAGVAGEDLAPRVHDARHAFAEASLLDPPPFIGAPPDPDAPVDPGLVKFFGRPGPPEVDEDVLRGSAGSRGRAEGIARVVRSVDELHRLQPGEILVCRSTTPPWTPAFASIAALVTDTGGVLAHGAIVAREYAIPAVMGTKIGTRVIQDGQRITVNGDSGTVLLA